MTSAVSLYRAYGLVWSSQVPLTHFAPLSALQDAACSNIDIRVEHPHGATPERAAPERTVRRRGRHLWFARDGVRYLGPHGLVIDSFGGDRLALYGPHLAPDVAQDAAQTAVQNAARNPPLPFYGTMAAVLLAARGLVPLHGSGVQWNGKAMLFCGPSGAGKSTLAAALLTRGASLIADDLSVLHCRPGALPLLFPGRVTLRLHAATAEVLLRSVPCGPSETTGSKVTGSKVAITPPCAEPSLPAPLGAVVLLTGPGAQTIGTGSLAEQLYRPRAMRELPGHRWRLTTLAFAQAQLPVLAHDPGHIRSQDDFERAADSVIRLLRTAGL